MTLALIVMGIMAIVMYNKGYSFEKMLPKLLIVGGILFLLPKLLGGLIVLPFHIIGVVMGAIGGAIGIVFGSIGAVIGLLFGGLGILIGAAVLLLPLMLVILLLKALT
ncbi:hypothetical protein ACR6HW_10040 [Fusibacter sp. JL298sf-3]